MGLLDDAIREHLDLKRRRGADPTEIERAEREALGPVRRGPEVSGEDVAPGAGSEAEAGYPAADAGVDYPPAETEAGDPSAEPESEHWERFEEDPELEAVEHDDQLPYEPARAPDGDPLMDDERLVEDEQATAPPHRAEPADDPGSASHAPDPLPPTRAPHPDEIPPHLDQETEEYELEHEHEDERKVDDDVLETTPEFLQDAPEHDRLWFEQRPPRDFDFDG